MSPDSAFLSPPFTAFVTPQNDRPRRFDGGIIGQQGFAEVETGSAISGLVDALLPQPATSKFEQRVEQMRVFRRILECAVTSERPNEADPIWGEQQLVIMNLRHEQHSDKVRPALSAA